MHSPSPLRVLHVAAPGNAGGLESVLVELTVGLHQSGLHTGLAAVVDSGSENHPVPQLAASMGVEVHLVAVPARGYLSEYRQLRDLMRRFRPHAVHTHGYRADLVGGLAARSRGMPWVTTVHGFTGGGVKNRFYEWLQTRSYRGAQAVVAVSRPIRDRLLAIGMPPDRVHVLPNAWGAKPGLSRVEARQRLGIEGTGPVVGWVGRLSREKGADVFLEALARLPSRPWQASVIGAGRERPALEAQARRLGIADRVTWHGLVTEAAALYRAFDIWVLSSRTEGTPIALFEAMAAGVPVVATSVGGVPDVITQSESCLVPPECPEALAAAIDLVLSRPVEAAARAEAAYLRLLEAFGTEAWIEAHIALYRAISRPVNRKQNA